MQDDERREELLHIYKNDRLYAHESLFPHRHKDKSPEFHKEMAELLYSDDPLAALMAFRGGAKSTWLEEFIILGALFQEFEFALLVGNSWGSACDRLAAVKYELETNDALIELFGDQKSSPWAADEIVLANGRKVQALGARQSMRGVKHNDKRPDLAAIDDLEDEENVQTEEARRKTERWLVGTLRPALVPKKGKVRFIGTPLHPKALIQKKVEDKTWRSMVIPIMYIDEHGEEQATWPSRFPLEWIHATKLDYLQSGNLIEFEQEYMCRAEDVAGKPFQANMIKVAAAPGHFIPKTMIVDPARTTDKAKSARTGYVAASTFGSQLLVHDAMGAFHKPDQIVDMIFEWHARHNFVEIGVEVNSLDEFILQPLRARMLQTGISLPLVPLHAPKSKLDFIKGLQPFYNSGNAIHMKPLPDLESELLQFPTGRMDVPNALAYILRMRAGKPVYQEFSHEHIAAVLEPSARTHSTLVMSSLPSVTTAILVQYTNDTIRVYKDWVLDKPPLEAFPIIYREAIMAAEGELKIVAPAEQFDKYANHGLAAAAMRDKQRITKVGIAATSEGMLKEWLSKRVNTDTKFLVSENAHWTINALAGGYCRKLERDGTLSQKPTDNQYRVLIEALEAYVSWFDKRSKIDDNMTEARYAVASDGRRYITSLPLGHNR